jgi:hypothetical protein
MHFSAAAAALQLLGVQAAAAVMPACALTHDNLHLEVVPPHLAAQRPPALYKAVSLLHAA